MSHYWRKKNREKKIRCCGKLKNGERCKNIFYPSNDLILTCYKHHNQKDATFWYNSEVGLFKDVAKIIADYIEDPTTFMFFAQTCKSFAKACHELQNKKIQQFKKPYFLKLKPLQFILPNGSRVDENNNFTFRYGPVTSRYIPKSILNNNNFYSV